MNERRERPARSTVRTEPTIVVIAGGAEGEPAARLLHRLLESRPGIRVSRGVPGPGEGCTHAILSVNEKTVRSCAGLHPTVAALTAPVQGAEALASAADMTVLDLDERLLRERYAAAGGRIFTYSGRRQQADLTAREVRLFPDRMEFEAVTVGQIRRIRLPVPGNFAPHHCLCALSCGLCLGLGLEEMARALRPCPPGAPVTKENPSGGLKPCGSLQVSYFLSS